MKRLSEIVFICTFVLMIGAVLTLGGMGTGPALAELDKEKRESLIGYSQTGNLGNTVAAGTAIDVGERWNYADEFTCYSFVTDSAGATDTGTASWQLEGSYDGTNWSILQGVSITASEYDLITNATAGAA